MKKNLAIVLSLCALFTMAACNGGNGGNANGSRDSQQTQIGGSAGDNSSWGSTADVREEDIVFSSPFSEGLAVVNLKDSETEAHVINKKGEIIFHFSLGEKTTFIGQNVESMAFSNGLLVYHGICYDKTGKVIAPESLGVTAIKEIARDKYVIVEKVTSDYASTKRELGVMDCEFNWLVPLSETNAKEYGWGDSDAFWSDIVGDPLPSLQYNPYAITNYHAKTDVVNGKQAIALWNNTASEMYFTVVNEKGEFLFEPVKTPITKMFQYSTSQFFFDGEHVILSSEANGGSGTMDASMVLYSYDINGNKVGELRPNISAWRFSPNFFKDGVLVFEVSEGTYSAYYRQDRAKYYTYDFKELF